MPTDTTLPDSVENLEKNREYREPIFHIAIRNAKTKSSSQQHQQKLVTTPSKSMEYRAMH